MKTILLKEQKALCNMSLTGVSNEAILRARLSRGCSDSKRF